MLRVGLYARVSTHDQKTLPMQLSAMRDYVKKRNWAVAVKVQDVGSGATTRPHRKKLMGLDPYVGWLHATRPGRPACALDLMEEFRPCLAERLALTLINRRQIESTHFREREGGAVEFTDRGRKEVIQAWQQRKQTEIRHALFKQNIRLGQVLSVQAKLLARKLRGDVPDYIPFISK